MTEENKSFQLFTQAGGTRMRHIRLNNLKAYTKGVGSVKQHVEQTPTGKYSHLFHIMFVTIMKANGKSRF
jgi:hypothetical protein